MSELKYCTYCKDSTRQDLVFETSKWYTHEVCRKKEKDSLAESLWTVMNISEKVYQCKGCERIRIFYVEDIPSKDPEYVPKEYQLPKKLKHSQPNWFKDIHIDYFELLGEIYSNLNNENYISFAICCRTLVDTILTDKIGDIGGFERKLNEYKSQDFITNTQKEILKFLINVGNASAHRAYKPSEDIATTLLETVEYILKQEVLVKKAQRFDEEIPSRR